VSVILAATLPVAAAKLNPVDAKRVWDFIIKLQENPAQSSISMERITQARDRNFWSGRISLNLRVVIHQEGDTRTILYVGLHDEAYQWARTRRLERNAVTGSLQLVESPEVVEPILAAAPGPVWPLFAAHADAYLLSLGLPPDWLPAIRAISTEDQLFDVASKLPEDVMDRLLDVADGKVVVPPAPVPPSKPATESTDARRSFFVLDESDDLRALLDAPLAAWLVFLHPSQRRLAEGTFKGPLKITGSAGTGKTVVAIHRARNLARQGKRVLFTTYVNALCTNLEQCLSLLCTPEELGRITVSTVHSRALALVQQGERPVHPTSDGEIRTLIEGIAREQGCLHGLELLQAEWEAVIQSQGIATWEGYRVANRVGRGTPLVAKERREIWQVLELVYAELERRSAMTYSDLSRRARELVLQGKVARPYDAVIVDEVQDLGPQELMLLDALGGDGQDGLTIVGDGGQRIYGKTLSLKSLGINVRGRSHVLRLNYRTTAQIRRFAERVLRGVADDLEGARDERRGVRSLLDGPEPLVRRFASPSEQIAFVVSEIAGQVEMGRGSGDIAIFARRRDLLEPLKKALLDGGMRYRLLTSDGGVGGVMLATMHGAKGLEYKVVFVIDVSDDQVPQPKAFQGIQEPQALEEALRREQQLLYVSITRARDEVYLTWVGERSRFIAQA